MAADRHRTSESLCGLAFGEQCVFVLLAVA